MKRSEATATVLKDVEAPELGPHADTSGGRGVRLRYGGWCWILRHCWFISRVECHPEQCDYPCRVHYRISIGPLEVWVDW
jgi:hypothetical protein